MSDQQAQGSIILKILILLVTIILIAVIIIPGQIWDKEEKIKNIVQSDIESLYEAHSFYYKQNQEYTSNMDTLLYFVNNDSSLKIKKRVVDYTVEIRKAIDDFLSEPLIESLTKVSQNVGNIETDFENNEIYFKKYEDIYTKAQDLKLKVSVLKQGVEQENYSMMAKSLDSLLNLRRDLQDYQLQVAARRAQNLSSSIVEKLEGVDIQALVSYWNPLNTELTDLMQRVNSTDLKTRTAVADRVEDFQIKVTSGLTSLQSNNMQISLQNTSKASQKINEVYEKFLSDFLTTEKYVQYKLEDSDSMLLNLSKSNFFTPHENKPYTVQFMDTLGLVVEDPTLADELREKALNVLADIQNLPFIAPYSVYLNTLDSINLFAGEIKTKYRRNAEIHFKSKDIGAVIDELKNTSTIASFSSLSKFISNVPNSNSYSALNSLIEDALLGIGVFKQIAESNIFGKLDTVHLDLVTEMESFNQLLSGVRRNTYSFDEYISKINIDLSQVKSRSTGKDLQNKLNAIELNLQDLFLFASEGKEETVYGVFSTTIMNHGKMYGRTGEKSWEEE